MIVDVHAHYMPQAYMGIFARLRGREPQLGGRPAQVTASGNVVVPRNFTTDSPEDIAGRIGLMDEAGVRIQVLSPAGNAPYAENEADAVEAAKVCNDTYADLVSKHPDRFQSFVSLPLPHVDASLREIARGMDELGMVGVAMNCSVFDRSVAEDEFEPIYAELNRRGAVLFYHPCQNGICSPFINDYGFTVAVGASLEDTAIVLHLIAKKIPARYPNIRIIVPHLGGMIPMQLARLDGQATQVHRNLPEKPSETARRFYYDTVGWGSQAALTCAATAFGADHIVTGSDYPILLSVESYKRTFEYISESDLPRDDIDRILNHNAAALLDLKQ